METAQDTDVLSATRQWLIPLIQVLIRSGIPWREFSELSKTVYVEVAVNQLGRRGRPATVSQAAVLTGLSRRDVRKLRDRIEAGPPALKSSVTKASQVLSAWHLDPEFADAEGKPKLLPLKGAGATFATLLER